MESVYSGILSTDGYLFITNDIFGDAVDECAIVKVNRFCGALIVTARGNFLKRVRKLLNKYITEPDGAGNGLSMDLAREIIDFFRFEFQQDPSYRENPLPFLLLLVGYNLKQPACLEHIFVRNRVVKISERIEVKEYITDFDIQSPVPAKNLFYGHSELSHYLSQQLPLQSLDLESGKLISLFAMNQTQKIDKSISPDFRMAVIKEGIGFIWIDGKELQSLSDKSRLLEAELSDRLHHSFVAFNDHTRT